MPQSASTGKALVKTLTTVLVTLIAVAFYILIGLSARENALKNDFLGFYAAGVMVRQGDGTRLHDHEVQMEYQRRIAPATLGVVPFPRPRYYAEVFRPLAAFPIGVAINYWQALQVLGCIGAFLLLVKRYGAEILQLTAFFFALPIGIAHGQDSGLMGFFASLSLYLWQGSSPLLAGAALGLCLFKWHLILLLPVAMLLGRQWRMLAGFAGVALATLLLDFQLDGLAGWRSYLTLLGRRDLDRMTPGITFMPNLQGLFANLFIPQLWWIGIVFVAVCFGLCAWRSQWPKAMLAAQLSAVLLVPHVFQFDLAYMLFPLVALTASGIKGPLKWAAFLLLVPPTYFCTGFEPPFAGILALAVAVLLGALGWDAYRTNGLRREVQLDTGR